MESFDYLNYISKYQDLQDAGINTLEKAWRHYTRYGKREGRCTFNLQNHLSKIVVTEGYCQQNKDQVKLLTDILIKYNIKSVLEIGFNAGHSAELFLKYSANVISFDIGDHDYLKYGKEFIDTAYPGRHTLILGNSTLTIPEYSSANPDKNFDLIFIDGAHDYVTANTDLVNCKKLSHGKTIVIMDDTVYTPGWELDYTIGPTKAWSESKLIKKISKVDFSIGRGMSWGRYIKSSIVCIAKLESNYIVDFVKYHLSIGFDKIYIYDNEDTPTYKELLHNYSKDIIVIHLPGNNYSKAVQYYALDHFQKNYLSESTHVAHIDIDEYIVLKQHSCISDFINEYFVGDCSAIGINWRHFGSNGLIIPELNIPVTERFTMCELKGNRHIKTLYAVDQFVKYSDPHSVILREGKTKSTNGKIINGPFNDSIDFSVIQLNHYKCKTLQEFKYIRSRGRADFKINPEEDILNSFKMYDINEITDLIKP
jgi:predicted O-methyltransferase YrrM